LGLSNPADLRRLEQLQIGSREIRPAERKRLEAQLEAHLADLPEELARFILGLFWSVRNHEVGFRRRNVPVLLAQYFNSIRQVLAETTQLLESNGRAFWIVGKNRTQLNGDFTEIDTPDWIARIGDSIGLNVEARPLNTYQRFGLHHRNSIRDEYLLTFQKN